MFERFTAPARQMVVFGQDEARLLEHNYIGSEHLLLGLLRAEEGVAADVLKDLGVTLERVRDAVRIGGSSTEPTSDTLRFTPRAKKTLEIATRETLAFGDGYITTAHILLALARVGESRAARILFDLGADAEHIGGEVLRLRSTTGDSWEEGTWGEPIAPGSWPRDWTPGPLRASAVRAVVEVLWMQRPATPGRRTARSTWAISYSPWWRGGLRTWWLTPLPSSRSMQPACAKPLTSLGSEASSAPEGSRPRAAASSLSALSPCAISSGLPQYQVRSRRDDRQVSRAREAALSFRLT